MRQAAQLEDEGIDGAKALRDSPALIYWHNVLLFGLEHAAASAHARRERTEEDGYEFDEDDE